uniref:ORFX protein n=1 Tax=Carex angustisquama waikavirus TaxID=3027337 RepID=A0AA48PAQ7_9SECO|nr:TPA_asm: ORFX protein [Carex angustisquama waikavirus]
MQRPLLIVSLAVNMLALFLQTLGLILILPVILIVGIFFIMLNIFLNVLALVVHPDESTMQFLERATTGTPLAPFAARPVPLQPRARA